jgi:hypothetical protein
MTSKKKNLVTPIHSKCKLFNIIGLTVMKHTCPNCSSPLFETDTVCWHCGQPQTLAIEQDVAPKPAAPEEEKQEEVEPELEPFAPGLIFVYGGLLLIIIAGLFLVTRSLGQSPTMALKSDETLGEWIFLTAPDKSFTIELPVTWEWYFQSNGPASLSENPAGESIVVFAAQPLGDFLPDLNTFLVAQHDANVLVVARSERLNRLSPEQAVSSLQSESFENLEIEEVRLIQLEPDSERASITLAHKDVPLHCTQHLVPGSSETYLVAACSPADVFDTQRRILLEILNTFTLSP